MAWGGLVPGLGGLGKDRTNTGSHGHRGMATSGEGVWIDLQRRNPGEGSQRSVWTLRSVLIFIVHAG